MLFDSSLYTRSYLEGNIFLFKGKSHFCNYIGISRPTLNKWLEKAPSYQCCVYFLSTINGLIYVGVTNNIKKRLKEHWDGKGSLFFKVNPIKNLMYTIPCNAKHVALGLESQFHQKSRTEVIQFLESKEVNTTNLRPSKNKIIEDFKISYEQFGQPVEEIVNSSTIIDFFYHNMLHGKHFFRLTEITKEMKSYRQKVYTYLTQLVDNKILEKSKDSRYSLTTRFVDGVTNLVNILSTNKVPNSKFLYYIIRCTQHLSEHELFDFPSTIETSKRPEIRKEQD